MQKNSLFKSKIYSDYNIKAGPTYFEYDNLEIQWGQPYITSDNDKYQIIKKLGRGKYSQVFEAVDTNIKQKCVIKILKPIRKSKIKRQIKILKNLQNGPNIIKLTDIVRDPASKTPCLVFEHINNNDYKQLYPSLKDIDVRFYMYQILKALDYCHSKGIMHRDVKPHNIMIDHKKKQLRIIDWGLAQFYFPGKDYNVRVASRYFKGPQLLADFQYYDYSLDIWSLGATFAGIIFQRQPFFMGNDNNDQLQKINKVLGTKQLVEYFNHYNIKLEKHYEAYLGKHSKRPWTDFITVDNQHLATSDAIDLLSKMLVYDHGNRITAKDAMKHQYFATLKK